MAGAVGGAAGAGGAGGGVGGADYASRFEKEVGKLSQAGVAIEVQGLEKGSPTFGIMITPDSLKAILANRTLGGVEDLVRDGMLSTNNLTFAMTQAGAVALAQRLAELGPSAKPLFEQLKKAEGNAAIRLAMNQAYAKTPATPAWVPPGGAATKSNVRDLVATALEENNIPSEVSRDYSFKISATGTLSINPPGGSMRERPLTRGVSVTNNAVGGKDVKLEGGPITRGEWVKGRLTSMVKPEQLVQLEDAGYKLTSEQRFLAVRAEGDEKPTFLLFAPGGKQFVSICEEVAIHDMPSGSPGGSLGGGGGGVTVRKPVVYLYPERRTEMTVKVTIAGTFIAQYPKADGDTWRLVADPNGVLFDPKTERRYSYIFWEGLNPNAFEIDRTKAHCIAGDKAEAFLEMCADKYALNDRERTDFVSYWLPSLEANRFNLIQVLDDATYEGYARMVVTPTPETTLRLFMIFSALTEPAKVGSPAFEARLRKGSCVVEWGGCNLDEPARH